MTSDSAKASCTASRSGQNGRDASSPTDGGSGGDIEVGLKYDHNRPGLIQVIPSARAWYDQFELSGHEQLFLDVQGGKGGDGGYGEVRVSLTRFQ